jgi:hypothetical protein
MTSEAPAKPAENGAAESAQEAAFTNPVPTLARDAMKRVQAWQVQAFYELLCDCGLDDVIQAAMEVRREQQKTRKPVSATDQVDQPLDPQTAELLAFQIDLPKLIRVLGREKRTLAFFSIVLGKRNPEEVEEVTMDVVMDFFTGFMVASLQPIGMLTGYVDGMVSG